MFVIIGVQAALAYLHILMVLSSSMVLRSCLGPLHFILNLNDICDVMDDNSATLKLYADDMKLYCVMETNF